MVELLTLTKLLVNRLPKLETVAKRSTLSVKSGEQTSKLLQNLLGNSKNPLLDIAYNSRPNYSIVGLRLRDGKNVIEQGVLSIAEGGNVIKYRASVGQDGGKFLTKGFIDKRHSIDKKDFAVGIARQKGKVKVDLQTGKFLANHTVADEQSVVNLSRTLASSLKGLLN